MLRKKGMTLKAIAAAADVPVHVVASLLRRSQKPRLRKKYADAFEKLTFNRASQGSSRIDPTDTVVTLRALTQTGLTYTDLAKHTDLTANQLREIGWGRFKTISQKRSDQVHRLAEELQRTLRLRITL